MSMNTSYSILYRTGLCSPIGRTLVLDEKYDKKVSTYTQVYIYTGKYEFVGRSLT